MSFTWIWLPYCLAAKLRVLRYVIKWYPLEVCLSVIVSETLQNNICWMNYPIIEVLLLLLFLLSIFYTCFSIIASLYTSCTICLTVLYYRPFGVTNKTDWSVLHPVHSDNWTGSNINFQSVKLMADISDQTWIMSQWPLQHYRENHNRVDYSLYWEHTCISGLASEDVCPHLDRVIRWIFII